MKAPTSPHFWWACFLIWFCVLFYLSGRPVPEIKGPDVPFADKIAHFGYFFGGAGLLSAALYCRPGKPPKLKRLIWIVTAILTFVGVTDEFHQSFVPERYGNDPFDLLADSLGALTGAFIFTKLKHLVSRTPDPKT